MTKLPWYLAVLATLVAIFVIGAFVYLLATGEKSNDFVLGLATIANIPVSMYAAIQATRAKTQVDQVAGAVDDVSRQQSSTLLAAQAMQRMSTGEPVQPFEPRVPRNNGI